MVPSTELARVDHLVFAAPALEAGVSFLEELLGVHASPGGSHPRWGTCNALLALGPTTYLEVIARDPSLQPGPRGRPFGLDAPRPPRLVTWAAKARHLPALRDSASAAGIHLGEVTDGSRRQPDGALLSWQLTDPYAVVAEGLMPFFIDWGTSPHPASRAAPGAKLLALRAEHPQPEEVGELLRKLGLELALGRGPRAVLFAELEGPGGRSPCAQMADAR